MYHRFAKSLKPSNRTISVMASNPACLGVRRWNGSIFTGYRLSGKCLKSLNSHGGKANVRPLLATSSREQKFG
jgi:hypothetical protein